ncbi:MAG: PAS domain S-box protein [Spirochaetia bacterium]
MAASRKKASGNGSADQLRSYEEKRFQSIFQHSAVSLWEEDISSLRAALDALRAQGVRDLRRYLEEHPEFLTEAARMITVINVNEATLALYQVADRRQLLGPLDRTLDMEDPVTRASLRDDVLLIAEGGTSAERESKATTPSGRKLDIVIKLSVPGPHDSYPHMLVNVLDITQRKHVEEELHRSRQLLQLVLDHVPQRVFWKDRSLHYLGCNRLFAEDAGLSDPASIVGRNDLELSWRRTAERYRADDASVIETGVPKINYEEPQAREDGSLLWLRTSKVPLREQDGRIFGVLGTYEDITENRQAGEALRESEDRYRTLVENLGEGIGIVDPAENFLFANPAAEKVFGVGRGGLTGQNLRQFMSEEEYQRTRGETGKRRLGEKTTYEQEIIRPDGTVRRIELTATPEFDKGGAFSHTLGIFHDITDERRTEEALRKSEEKLAQAQKLEAVGRLAGGVAHDFNNLLTVIRGYADLLDEQLHETHPMKGDAREIKRAADRAAALTAQLLAFSRGQVMRPRILDLNEVVRGMQSMIGRLIGEDVELRTILTPDLATIKADQGQLEQVTMNLAANARDAMPRGGILTISTATYSCSATGTPEHAEMIPGDYVTLEVSDTGVGIDRETLARIFEPFFTTKEVGRGTGLGLATVYGIVKQSDGYIYCASRPGAGTTFTVYLPRVREAVPGKSTTVEARSLPGSESVLVVEDEEAICNFILSILRKNGYDATGARSGPEAMSIFSSRPGGFQLVLADVVMPRMSGIELGRWIAEAARGVKVLYMTGYSKHALVQADAPEGGLDILRKPFTAEQLLKKIREVLDAD